MFVGSDWKNTGAWNGFERRFQPIGAEIVCLDHTYGISLTILKNRLNAEKTD